MPDCARNYMVQLETTRVGWGVVSFTNSESGRKRMPFNDKTQETMMRERKASQVVVNEIDECDVK